MSESTGAVWIVAAGAVHQGRETYTRHETRPPLCDAECLYPASELDRLQRRVEAARERIAVHQKNGIGKGRLQDALADLDLILSGAALSEKP